MRIRGIGSPVVLLCAMLLGGCGGAESLPRPQEMPEVPSDPTADSGRPADPGLPGEDERDGDATLPVDSASPSDSASPGPPPSNGLAVSPDRMERPASIRGLYLNAWVSGSSLRSQELIAMARRTEVNTFVIDVKDASGYVSYPTGVSVAKEVGADREIRIRDVRALLARLEAERIWPIARIVVFKDPLLAAARPDAAVQDSVGGPWIDGRGDVWVNPWNEEVWEYHIALAREAVALGFREIQWDYIRFPDRPASELATAVFPGADGRSRSEAVREFLLHARKELDDLGVPVTADVFGVTTMAAHDVGIGQLWEDFIDAVDAALPMIYPSHYWEGSFGIAEPNAHPYEIVYEALRHAVRRTEGIERAGAVIPWLQDFTLGTPPYGAPEVRAQIQATYDAGLTEWILWNASGRYTEGALEPVDGWPGGVEPAIRKKVGVERLPE